MDDWREAIRWLVVNGKPLGGPEEFDRYCFFCEWLADFEEDAPFQF